MDTQLEQIEFKVPIDGGHLIGNTLRQFAMRGTRTWQPAAYRIAGKEGSFGLSGGYPYSYLVFLRGYIAPCNITIEGTEVRRTFHREGGSYICDGMELKGLDGLGAPSLDVCLVYARGSRTKEQNHAVAERLCPYNVEDFMCVPSKHNPTIKFSYNIEPYDRANETLIIRATPGVVALARDSVMKSIAGLHI